MPLIKASANLGLFCLSKASWSGLARNISLIMRGSSSTDAGVLAAIEVPGIGGTEISLKSSSGRILAAKQNNLFNDFFSLKTPQVIFEEMKCHYLFYLIIIL